ncbi:MAG: tripartite tricarboxylate transporter TctB family protein [Betaproteobacteria bacterium]|nr:tripartite tricarboxylate transporter TctB family protein [Betaproteobacteria bacterium]MBI2292389.1 tripartite tricarboxylate transporter TctB family protein [Betaproteobacteria bacterium]MBI3052788.1 tripartite tricarboxylate transporter TctB family protein [Betaproteobacteria bacterium]
MNKGEAVAGAVCVAIGVLMLLESIKFPYFVEGVPGPGFLPLWISLGIIGAGLVLAVKGIRPRLVLQEGITWPEAAGWRRVGLMLGALAVSLLLLEILGFMVTTTLFMAVVVFGLGVRSWRMLAAVPLLSAVGLYAIFAVWLRVPLPKGILAFFG